MSARATPRSWLGLVVLTLPMLLIAVDSTVLHLALPAITRALSPTASQQLWIIDVYSFVLAGLLITMGALGDRLGRRKLLLIGAALFAAASVAGAYTSSAIGLILARAALGLAGATLMPSTLSLLRTMFLDRGQRRFAMAAWMTMGSAGAAVGPVVGGWLLEHYWWGSAFLINIPVMVLLLIAGPLLLPETPNLHSGRFDLISVALSLAGVLSLVYGLKSLAEGNAGGRAATMAVAGAVALAAFVRRQRRLPAPLINIGLFAVSTFRGAVIVDLMVVFAVMGSTIVITQYLLLVSGMGPLEAALWLLPSSVFSTIAGFLAAGLVKRIGTAPLVTTGLLLAASGSTVLLTFKATLSPTLLAASLSLIALGAGVGLTLTNDVIMSSVSPARAGQAAAISETAYELGIALGTAMLGSLVTATYRLAMRDDSALQSTVGPDSAERASSTIGEAITVAGELSPTAATVVTVAARDAYTAGLALTAGAGAVVLIIAAILAFKTLRRVSSTDDLTMEDSD
ncbi:MFS transporter [Micromonospora sp. NPDC005324]|uniref:MFS transporter n=1 Tax=Micromonospora sp. NPDC005324 TaxID=3157033 RepID=UPI0033BC6903